MTRPVDPLLAALDRTPSTVEALARALGRPAGEVEEALGQAEDRGLAVCWGDLWATTWRAKLVLAPAFFRRWVPASIAVGALVALLGVALNARGENRWMMVGLFVIVLIASAATFMPAPRTATLGEGSSPRPPS